jgi:tetratricopeptide (TPR) repeat protein
MSPWPDHPAAGQERTRERVPLDWAATQNNRGAALSSLGDRESGTARLEQAVAAYDEALKEYTRERVPLDWVATQTGLGNALASLGERESGTARLEEAVAAYRAALEVWTRERAPREWAMTENNLGTALKMLGDRQRETGGFTEATAAYGELVEICRRVYASAESNESKSQLADALGSLSFVLLFNHRAGDALVAAKEAVSLDPGALWVEAVEKRACRGRRVELNSYVVAGVSELIQALRPGLPAAAVRLR